jgi:hypothetical protein
LLALITLITSCRHVSVPWIGSIAINQQAGIFRGWKSWLSMPNWHPVVERETRAIERERQIEQLRSDSAQIERETEQLRNEEFAEKPPERPCCSLSRAHLAPIGLVFGVSAAQSGRFQAFFPVGST